MGRIPVDKERIKNRKKQLEISGALAPIFFKEGFSHISTEDLCKIANKSKATIYKYFESKEDMVAFITIGKLEEINSFAGALSDESVGFSDRYINAVKLVMHALDGISYAFLSDVKKEYPALYQAILDLKNASIMLLEDFYEQGIEIGAFKIKDSKLLAAMDDMFFITLLETDFLSQHNFDLRQLFEGYFALRFEGLLA